MPSFNQVTPPSNGDEVWKSIAGTDGRYLISTHGRVWSTYTKRLLKFDYPNGYARVKLGATTRRFVHLLVLETFVGLRPQGMEGCHNNGDRIDARVVNLRWDTRSANQFDRHRHGTASVGEKNGRSKLTDRDVRFIRRAYVPRSRKRGAMVIAERLGVHPVTIEQIARGEKRIYA